MFELFEKSKYSIIRIFKYSEEKFEYQCIITTSFSDDVRGCITKESGLKPRSKRRRFALDAEPSTGH
ncbi:hypothetical protein Y032_0050g2049 [Ancylostoma ceylanicum]|uniref:Uncharacterized protein n=1 Tax=Ancylostoma ceylanicum TaxID=53326 RepID=A0A016UAS3_9BILA|nr:hypothetical protein Y032_0050g2049 [Ancylostoma ceylanicum]